MHLPLKYDLPCVTVRIGYQGAEIDVPDVVGEFYAVNDDCAARLPLVADQRRR